MGEVFRATEVATGREVAVKILLSGSRASHATLERFRRERLALAQVCHPNVLTVHSAGSHQGSPYLVTEVVEGGDLAEWIEAQEDPPPLGEGLRLLSEVAEGMAALHAAGILHRDLKPANVLLGAPGPTAKVADFGLALDLEGSETLTKSGTMLGTPAYMAPEAMSGARVRDPRADVYSLGVLAYELTTGRLPHTAPNLILLLVERSENQAPDPRVLCPQLPSEIAELIMAAMQADPAERPADAREFADRLAAAHDAKPSSRPLRGVLVGAAILLSACALALLWTTRAGEVAALPPTKPPVSRTPGQAVDTPAGKVTRVRVTQLDSKDLGHGRDVRSGALFDRRLLTLVTNRDGFKIQLCSQEEASQDSDFVQSTWLRRKLAASAWNHAGLGLVSETGEVRYLPFSGQEEVLSGQLAQTGETPRCMAWQGPEFWIGCESGRIYRWRPGQSPWFEVDLKESARLVLPSKDGLHLLLASRAVPTVFQIVSYRSGRLGAPSLTWPSTPTALIHSPEGGFIAGTSAQEVLSWQPDAITPFRLETPRRLRTRNRLEFGGIKSFPVHEGAVGALGVDRALLYSVSNPDPTGKEAELMIWRHETGELLLLEKVAQGHVFSLLLRPNPAGCDVYLFGSSPALVHLRVDYLAE
tara:strand:- start:154 stop:2085 length:1932 start_codon:yes stop_codon:yes gene_type:complete